MTIYKNMTEKNQAKAIAIIKGCAEDFPPPACQIREMACALTLLTSPLKSEREQGKQMVRDWRFDNSQTQNPA